MHPKSHRLENNIKQESDATNTHRERQRQSDTQACVAATSELTQSDVLSAGEHTWQPKVGTVQEVGSKGPSSLNLVPIKGGVDKARQEHQRLMGVAIHWPATTCCRTLGHD